MNYYGGNNMYSHDNNALELALEAIKNLPDDIDLSVYDNDGDGVVDNVHIIFAGYGEESGGSVSAIWSHEYPHTLNLTKNGYKFAGYSCSPELRSNFGKRISRIGVICHELGHAFGANDFYDVDYSSNGQYEGTGEWDLMASGSWNNNGVTPANFNPYVKIVDFGWARPIVPQREGEIFMDPYNTTPCVLSLSTSNPGDYYLLEFRKKQNFDLGVPGEGILIYHVHPQIESRRASNTINNQHPQNFYPVCASNRESPFSTSKYGDINSTGCPFPGTTSTNQLSSSTIPNVFQWDGGTPNFSINDIRILGDRAQLNIDLDGQTTTEPIVDKVMYKEGFENNLSHFFSELINGKSKWEIYPTNSLNKPKDMPSPYEGTHALMLYSGTKSGEFSHSTLTSENIKLNPDSLYVFSFWLRTFGSQLPKDYNFSVSIQNQFTKEWESVYQNYRKSDEWTEISIPLPESLSNLCYRLSGEIFNSGIFIDDIHIKSVNSSAKPEFLSEGENISIVLKPFSISAQNFVNVGIYNLMGSKLYEFRMTPGDMVTPILDNGIYIIYTDKGDGYKVVIKNGLMKENGIKIR